MPEEVFDVVDSADRVVGRAPRSEVHARGLLHRAVSVFVFDPAGRLLVQKRTETKDEFPGRWTSSASGHLAAGEDYDAAAPRELEEELGLRLPLERLEKFAAGAETANEHTVLYRAVAIGDELFRPDPAEIAEVAWREVSELAAEVEAHPERFTPPFRVLLRWYASRHTSPQRKF
ncbi:MAG: NUDIX domain-containing protein [Planctomycetales bacterium]